jgi:PhzF family phenazine biosynthesis protein
MMMDLRVYQVDSFTKELFGGNPAGVVTNADCLDGKVMQAIARELNNSETAFIFNEGGTDYDVEVRFFTPTLEVPICGHATIAAHYVYAMEKGISAGTVVQKTKAGILPVDILPDGDDKRVVMTQAGIEFGSILDGDRKLRLLRGLGINPQDLEESLPIQIVSTGHSKVMVPLLRKETLDSIQIDSTVLSALSASIGCNGYYAFTFDSGEENVLTSGRMFAPAIGIREDPVTGNANGPLGAYLTRYGKLMAREEGLTFTIKQGEAIGRKGYMDVHVYSQGGEPRLIKISGNARIAFKTTISLGK